MELGDTERKGWDGDEEEGFVAGRVLKEQWVGMSGCYGNEGKACLFFVLLGERRACCARRLL